jgi:hypothetical protein
MNDEGEVSHSHYSVVAVRDRVSLPQVLPLSPPCPSPPPSPTHSSTLFRRAGATGATSSAQPSATDPPRDPYTVLIDSPGHCSCFDFSNRVLLGRAPRMGQVSADHAAALVRIAVPLPTTASGVGAGAGAGAGAGEGAGAGAGAAGPSVQGVDRRGGVGGGAVRALFPSSSDASSSSSLSHAGGERRRFVSKRDSNLLPTAAADAWTQDPGSGGWRCRRDKCSAAVCPLPHTPSPFFLLLLLLAVQASARSMPGGCSRGVKA